MIKFSRWQQRVLDNVKTGRGTGCGGCVSAGPCSRRQTCLPVPGVGSREALGVQVNTYVGPSIDVTIGAGPLWSVKGGLHDRTCALGALCAMVSRNTEHGRLSEIYLTLWLGQAAKHSLPSCGGCLYLLCRHVVRRLCWDDRRHRTPVDCPKADELSGKILQQAMPQVRAPCMWSWQCFVV